MYKQLLRWERERATSLQGSYQSSSPGKQGKRRQILHILYTSTNVCMEKARSRPAFSYRICILADGWGYLDSRVVWRKKVCRLLHYLRTLRERGSYLVPEAAECCSWECLPLTRCTLPCSATTELLWRLPLFSPLTPCSCGWCSLSRYSFRVVSCSLPFPIGSIKRACAFRLSLFHPSGCSLPAHMIDTEESVKNSNIAPAQDDTEICLM